MPHIAFLSAASELSCQCVSQSAIAFPNNIPRIAFLSANSEPSCQCVWHSAVAFPNRTTHTEKSTKTYASISTGSGAETVPQPRRTRAATAPHQAFRHELPSAYFSSRHAPARTRFTTFRNSEVSLLNFLWWWISTILTCSRRSRKRADHQGHAANERKALNLALLARSSHVSPNINPKQQKQQAAWTTSFLWEVAMSVFTGLCLSIHPVPRLRLEHTGRHSQIRHTEPVKQTGTGRPTRTHGCRKLDKENRQ